MRPARVLVCGNPTLDELIGGRQILVKPGGSALFASCAAAFLGDRVGILGNIGRDYPRSVLTRLMGQRVDISNLVLGVRPSTRFRITRFNGSRKLQLIEPGRSITAPASLGHFEAVHLGPVFNEISGSLAKTLRAKANFVSADLQGFIRRSSPTRLVHTVHRNLGRLLSQCDMVQASIDEARSQARIKDPVKIPGRFLEQGVQYAILTLGKRGSLLGLQSGANYFVPAYPDQGVIDSTGAGDVFAGSWLGTYLSTKDSLWASAVGSAFASLASRKTGLSKFQISRTELFRRASWVYEHVEERN